MLKKILGEAPFDVFLDKPVVIVPGKKTLVKLLFSNISEYDLPLSCSLAFLTSVEADRSEFDIVVPADGKTECELIFSKDPASRMFSGCGIAELEIVDRILDSRTLYEFEIMCESAYSCVEKNEGFTPTDCMLFTNGGRFFANKGETVVLEIPLIEPAEHKLCVISGKIKDRNNGEVLKLTAGINRLLFEMSEDGSFEFRNTSNDELVYHDTLNTKYFI